MISKKEVRTTMKRMKSKQSADPHGTSMEARRWLGEMAMKLSTRIFNKIHGHRIMNKFRRT